MEGASDDGAPTDVEGASDGGYSTVDTVGNGPEWSSSPTMDGRSERSGDGTLGGLSWPTQWPGFGRLPLENGDGPEATNGPSQMQNGHVQNGKPLSIEATARLASKGVQTSLVASACIALVVPLDSETLRSCSTIAVTSTCERETRGGPSPCSHGTVVKYAPQLCTA